MAVEHPNQALLASNIPTTYKEASKGENYVFLEPVIRAELDILQDENLDCDSKFWRSEHTDNKLDVQNQGYSIPF